MDAKKKKNRNEREVERRKEFFAKNEKSTPIAEDMARQKIRRSSSTTADSGDQWVAPLISPGSPVNPPSYLLLIIH